MPGGSPAEPFSAPKSRCSCTGEACPGTCHSGSSTCTSQCYFTMQPVRAGQGKCGDLRWAVPEERYKHSLEVWATSQIVFHHLGQLLLIGQLQDMQRQNPGASSMKEFYDVILPQAEAFLIEWHQLSAECTQQSDMCNGPGPQDQGRKKKVFAPQPGL